MDGRASTAGYACPECGHDRAWVDGWGPTGLMSLTCMDCAHSWVQDSQGG